ncbi:hypothetical protein Tco_0544011 [Tanacetum coccineum]
MTTLADKSLLSGGDNKPPMLEKHLYDSWKSIMELYMMNRPHGRMILASVEKGPLVWPTITVDGVTRPKEYTELTPAETIQADCDIKAINIILQGLPTEIYALVSQHRVAKDIWEKIKLLMQGTSLTKQERECKLYDEFDKFTYKKGESLHEYYLRFTLLLNDMNIYKMPLEQFQVNTKFLNTLPAEWSKFVTDVKLVKDLHTTNVDQIHAHLEQHERHANEVRLMHERNSDPLALYGSPFESQQYSINQSPTPHSITYPPNNYQTSVHHNVYSPSSSIPQIEYSPTVNQQSKFSQLDSGLTILVFKHVDDPIDAINHVMSLLSVVGRQISYAAGTTRTSTPGASRSHSGKQRIVTYYNCKGEGYMSKQCTKPMRKQDDSWFKDKVLQNVVTSFYFLKALFQDVHIFPRLHLRENEMTSDSNIIPYSYIRNKVKVLKEANKLDLRSNDNVSDSSAQSVEIDRLKQTLFEHLEEKESLMQTVSFLKDDFKKEEYRNIDREIALKKRIKQLDNIKAQQLEPKLYVGDIIEKTNPIVIPDFEETLMLAE